MNNRKYVFLIGAARSGTKLLRDLLQVSRDACAIPFDINYIWRYGHEHRRDDHIPADAACDETRRYIADTFESMIRKARGKGCPILIEKSVSNVFRVHYIHALFPEARFVHLIRDGREVTESAARMWCAPTDYRYMMQKLRYFPLRRISYAAWFLKNAFKTRLTGRSNAKLWGPRYPGIEEDAKELSVLATAAKQWVQSVKCAAEGLQAVPEDQQVTIRYEDLVDDPRALRPVMDLIGICDADTVMQAWRVQVRQDQRNKWQRLDRQDQAAMYAILEQTLAQQGYVSGKPRGLDRLPD